jgi:L-rhamnose isomerase
MNMTGTASFGSLTAAQQQDVRTTEIPHQMECVERTLKGCEQGLETLEAKLLGSVLRQQPPTAG